MILRGHNFLNNHQKTWTIFMLLEEISMLIYKMSGFEKLTIKELKVLAKARSNNSCENMYRQQLDSILTTSPTTKPKLKLASKPQQPILFLKPKKA